MFHNYVVSIKYSTISNQFSLVGTEAAMHGYHAAIEFMEAFGLEAVIDLIDGETGEILASTDGFEI